MKQFINEIARMQKLAGIITESEAIKLNEEMLTLKKAARDIFMLLKSKGFQPKYRNDNADTSVGKGDDLVYVTTFDKEEYVAVSLTPNAVARVLVKGDSESKWYDAAIKKFGKFDGWINNKEIIDYVNKLGNEVLAKIKESVPDFQYKFERKNNVHYVLYFAAKKTKKGGEVNPKQRPNAPKPEEKPQA